MNILNITKVVYMKHSPQSSLQPQTPLNQKLLHVLVRLSSRVVESQPMTRHRRKVRSEVCISDIRIVLRPHSFRLVDGVRAVAATERQIVRAVDDSNGSAVIRRQTAQASKAVQLAVRDAAFGRFSLLEDHGCEAGGFEEADLVGDDGVGDEEGIVQRAKA